MSESHFVSRLQRTWEELGELVAKAHRIGLRRMSADDLSRLDRLYRVTTVHLAQASTRFHNEALLQSLNRLVSKAHSLIYVAPRRQPLMAILVFYVSGFARAVARTARFQLTAVLLFCFGAGAGYLATMQRPIVAYALMGGEDVRLPGASPEQLRGVLRSGRTEGDDSKFVFASFLMTHNIKVGFMAFALGVMAGIPTVFLILLNGAMLGAFLAVHQQKGITYEVYAWLLPHGVSEISAIILCGGAGLMLGMAILRPGYVTRCTALVKAGREALFIILGVVPMFIFAGLIESYVRQSHMGAKSRLLFAAGTALLWALYFLNGALQEYLAQRRAKAIASHLSTVDSVL